MSFAISNTNIFKGGGVDTSIIPSNTGVSLGSTSKKFKDLYLESDSLYLGNVKLSESAGNLVITDSNGNPQSLNGLKFKNISFIDFKEDIINEATFTIQKTLNGLTINTAMLEIIGIPNPFYKNDIYNNNPLIYVNYIKSESKRLCGIVKIENMTERDPVDNSIITWNNQYNATQASLGTYILGIYGDNDTFYEPSGFFVENAESSNKIWLESANLEQHASGTIINFNFKQNIPIETGNLGQLNSKIYVYGLS